MLRLTRHASEAMQLRQIPLDWVLATIETPDWVSADPRHPERIRSFKRIAAQGRRVLRVVHRPDGADTVVITAPFDRSARR